MGMMISPNSQSQPASAGAGRGDLRRTALLVAAMAVLGVAALWQATMGFRVVSTEEGRRLAIAEAPLALVPARLVLPGVGGLALRVNTLPAVLAGDGRVAVVTFFYARCNAVCSVQGSELQQMQREILARGLQDQVRLLTISFDPRDTGADLAAYSARMRAEPSVWQFATVPDAGQRRALLEQVGIIVLPAELGEFQHNAAFHIVGRDGRMSRVVDYEQPEAALHAALELAQFAASGPRLARAAGVPVSGPEPEPGPAAREHAP
ncbi:SCO family protein [Massilia sp. SR12]